ncbi:MAG: hypothetical protein ACR2NZ_19215 [Rubripirellula sp.]
MKFAANKLQFSLLTLLLLATTCAVWIGDWRLRHRIQLYQTQLPALRNLARELTVGNPSEIAVVSPHADWPDDYRWKLHAPPSPPLKLNLQLRDIDNLEFGKVSQSIDVRPGDHDVILHYHKKDGSWHIDVEIDRETVMTATMPEHWNLGRGSSGGNVISQLESNASLPLELFRRRFMIPTGRSSSIVPDGGCDGVLLWLSSEP